MPEDAYYELIYYMDIVKVEKGSYLFKPGDICDTIYVITDG